MKTTLRPSKIKGILSKNIKSMAATLDDYVRRPGHDFSRNRKLTFETMLQMLIGMGGNSLCKELYEWFSFSKDTASVSAFVQQREKILPSAIETLFHRFVASCDESVLFNGYRLFAVDGTDLRLPTNPSDSESYMKNESNTKGYNLVHIDAMYDLMRHVYVDASVQPKKGMNEHKALVSMVDRSNYSGKVIVIADRGYESFNNIAHFQEKSWNYIIRSKESYGIISKLAIPDQAEFDIQVTLSLTRRQTKQTLSLLKKDPVRYRWIQPHTTFDYLYPKDDRLYDLCFRVVRFAISDVSYETVFTNLDFGNFPPDTIKELYNRRWGIETSFRELKYAVGLGNLHSKKPGSMLQEVFSRFILYNFSALIAHQAQIPNEATKRINFSVAMLFCRQYFRDKLSEDSLLDLIAKHLSLIRKGRKFPRFQNPISAVGFTCRVS